MGSRTVQLHRGGKTVSFSALVKGVQSMRLDESQSDHDPVSSVTASEIQSGPQGPGKQGEGRLLGRVPHLWTESPGWLPSKPPWDCWPSAEQVLSVFLQV